MVEELKRTVSGKGFDEQPLLEAKLDEIDFQTVAETFNTTRTLTENDLEKLRFLTRIQGQLVPTVGGMLLFGKRRDFFFPDAWIQCGRFFGIEKVDIFDHIDIPVPLPKAVDEIMLFLKKHAMRGADLSEIRRKDVWSIPLSILREAVINAIVHTDYSQRGAPIRVVFLDNRIEIENPGILLPGLTIEDMKQGMSKIRNQVIARTFRELDLIEQWGTGIRRIFQEAEQQGLPEPEIIEIGMRVRMTIFLAKIHNITSPDEGVNEGVNEGVKSLLFLIQETPGKRAPHFALTMSTSVKNIERWLKQLRDMGKIEFRGAPKTGGYFVTLNNE